MSAFDEELTTLLELEGFERGTGAFQAELLSRKVERCIELQGVPNCSECEAKWHCKLVGEWRKAQLEQSYKAGYERGKQNVLADKLVREFPDKE